MPPLENKNPPVPENKVEKNPIKALRTYQGDVEESLGKKKISKTTILMAEQERKGFAPAEPFREVDTKKRNKIFIWSGVTLFFLGIITVGIVYYVKSMNEVATVKQTKAIIAFSEEKDILFANLTRENLVKQILAEKKSFKLPLNSVLYINNTDTLGVSVSALNFTSLIAPQMPGSLGRSFEDKYMLGIYSYDTNEPFIIFTTNDFAGSFSGMLNWEKNIARDIGPIFAINTASTTTFVDEALQNKDLRVLKDNNRKSVLVYSFIDKNTLVITANENVLTAIVGKYIISKQTR